MKMNVDVASKVKRSESRARNREGEGNMANRKQKHREDEVIHAYELYKERIQEPNYAVDLAIRKLKRCL
jgi:hypothetical protein